MTTPLDEMVEEFFRFGEFYKDLTETGEKRDRRLVTKSELAQTLTKAHQAGIDEAVEKIFTWGCGNSLVVPFGDGRPLDVVEWKKLKETLKALQDNK